MTRAEQETIFRIAADEEIWNVFTAHEATANKLKRFGYQPYKISKLAGKPVGWFYRVPRSEFRWRAGKRRVLSEAQQAALRARGQALSARSSSR